MFDSSIVSNCISLYDFVGRLLLLLWDALSDIILSCLESNGNEGVENCVLVVDAVRKVGRFDTLSELDRALFDANLHKVNLVLKQEYLKL